MKQEKKKTVLIIGGNRGIGKAIGLRMAGSGWNIWFTYYRHHDAAAKTKRAIEKLGVACRVFRFDVSDYQATQDALGKLTHVRPPDALVYNAGIAQDNLIVLMSKDQWNSVISTNLTGFYNVVHTVLFGMLRASRGRIVVVSSASGQLGHAGQVNYSASKAGLIGAAKALAREVGKKNINVNVVSPGVIVTSMTRALPKDKLLPLISQARFGTPEDVAALVDFLCSEKHMYIHGQVIGVNGGLVM